MKKNRIFGLASVIALLAAGACSNDTLDAGSKNGPNEAENGDGAYLAVTFDLPSAKETRSYTDGPNSSNSGTEVGHEYENTVDDAFIVLATTDNKFIAASRAMTLENVGATGISYRSTAMFLKTDLGIFYDNYDPDDNGNYFVNVFVFANPTDALAYNLNNTNPGDDQWVNYFGGYDETNNPSIGIIWTKNYFLMANSKICKRQLPSKIDDWNDFNTSSVPFNLSGMNNFGRPNEIDNLTDNRGNITVERAAARYDFRDGALDGIENTDPSYNGFKAQTYHVVLDSKENPLVDVFLGKMSLVNMNKEYYYLRRVSDNGRTNSTLQNGQPNIVTLLGPELPWYDNAEGHEIGSGNYVVDKFCDWKYSGSGPAPTSGFASHFNYPFFNEQGVMDNAETSGDSWYTSLISKVLAEGASDSWISGDVSDEGKGKYKTWRYLTEGTIPGIQSQKNSVSNGIVFKGLLQPAREGDNADDEFTQKLLNALKNSNDGNKLRDPILFVFGGHVYCTWDHIRRMAVYLSLTDLKFNETENKWDFTINRSTLLYNAVFGTGGFGEMTFSCDINGKLDNADFLTTSGTQKLVDDLAPNEASANYKYNVWKEAYPTDDDFVEENEAAEYALFDDFRKVAVASNIALYQTSYDEDLGGWGYYCYYYYWNRHNDNGQVGDMGPMEFAVVRNNVYKLAVTKIARLGHPRISANDPDKPTPNTPDEKGDVYITVTCTTLPWVVRENNIEF